MANTNIITQATTEPNIIALKLFLFGANDVFVCVSDWLSPLLLELVESFHAFVGHHVSGFVAALAPDRFRLNDSGVLQHVQLMVNRAWANFQPELSDVDKDVVARYFLPFRKLNNQAQISERLHNVVVDLGHGKFLTVLFPIRLMKLRYRTLIHKEYIRKPSIPFWKRKEKRKK